MIGTDKEPSVMDVAPELTGPPFEDMSDRELLVFIAGTVHFQSQQFAEITSMFGEMHEKIAEGGIGGLMKALLGR